MIKKIKKIVYRIFISTMMMILGFLKDKKNVVEYSGVVNDLNLHGLHTFKGRLSAQSVHELNLELDRLFVMNAPSTHGQLNNRVFSAGLVSEMLTPYTEAVLPYVRQYLNTNDIKIEISYFQKSFPESDIDNIVGGDFHVDDNKANLKYFVYLTDVTDLNGPFSVVLGTSRWRLKWSFLRGLLWAFTEKRKFLYDFLLNRKFCLDNETKILGKAGTHFIIDTTAVHRAYHLKQGERRVVVVSFNRR